MAHQGTVSAEKIFLNYEIKQILHNTWRPTNKLPMTMKHKTSTMMEIKFS